MTSRLNAANIAMLPENWQIIGLPRNSSTTANQVKKKWMKLGLSGRYRHPNKLTVLGPGIAPTTFDEQQALFQRLGQAYNRVTRNVKSGLTSQLGHAAYAAPRGPSPPRPRGPSPPRPRGPSPPRPRGPRMHHPPPWPQRRSFRNIARNAARTAARRAGNAARTAARRAGNAARTAARRAGNAARTGARRASVAASTAARTAARRASVAASTAARMGARMAGAGVATARRTRNYVQPHASRAYNTAARAALRAIERYEHQRSFRSQSPINNALLKKHGRQMYEEYMHRSGWEKVPDTNTQWRQRGQTFRDERGVLWTHTPEVVRY
jgi:hypothetical protein